MIRQLTASTLRDLARVTQSARKRPDPPVGLAYNGSSGVLSWEAPIRNRDITHYRVYAENEEATSLVREVSAGQTQIADLLSATTVLVVSYNVHYDIESEPAVLIGAGVTPPTGGGGSGAATFIYTPTLSTTTTSLVEPTLDDNGNALASAVIGDRLLVFVRQDATGGRKLTLGAAFKGRGGNLMPTADAYTVFDFVKKSNSDPKWWQTGAGISYA